MAFIDSILEFWDSSDGDFLTGSEESRTNGDILDLEADGATDAQMGFLWWNLTVKTVPTGMSSGGYFQLVTSDSETFATGTGGEQVIAAVGSDDLPLFIAQLPAGAKFSLAVPLRVLHRYTEVEWRVVSDSAGGSFAVDSWMGMEPVGPLNTQKEPS